MLLLTCRLIRQLFYLLFIVIFFLNKVNVHKYICFKLLHLILDQNCTWKMDYNELNRLFCVVKN